MRHAMDATDWYLLGCASGAFSAVVVMAVILVAIFPDLRLMRMRGRG